MRLRLTALAMVLTTACRSDPPPTVTASPTTPSPTASSAAPSGGAQPAPGGDCVSPEVRVIRAQDATATLVLLHGYGASAADMEPVGRSLAAGVPGLAVLVPDGCEPWEGARGGQGGARQWYGLDGLREETEAAHRERAIRVRAAAGRIQAAVARELPSRGLPTARIAYAGFSQGAMIAEWLSVHGAPRPRAVVAFSGRFDDDGEIAGGAAQVPVLLIHGERDRVIPFAEAGRAEQALRARGATVERLTRPAMGHSIDDPSIEGARAFLGRALAPAP